MCHTISKVFHIICTFLHNSSKPFFFYNIVLWTPDSIFWNWQTCQKLKGSCRSSRSHADNASAKDVLLSCLRVTLLLCMGRTPFWEKLLGISLSPTQWLSTKRYHRHQKSESIIIIFWGDLSERKYVLSYPNNVVHSVDVAVPHVNPDCSDGKAILFSWTVDYNWLVRTCSSNWWVTAGRWISGWWKVRW